MGLVSKKYSQSNKDNLDRETINCDLNEKYVPQQKESNDSKVIAIGLLYIRWLRKYLIYPSLIIVRTVYIRYYYVQLTRLENKST